jgi:hypothetical protein
LVSSGLLHSQVGAMAYEAAAKRKVMADDAIWVPARPFMSRRDYVQKQIDARGDAVKLTPPESTYL